jgi:NAD(P)H-dependent FMN reductase
MPDPAAPIMIIAGTNRPGANALKIARIIESHYQRHDLPCWLLSLGDLPREVFDPLSYATKPPGMVELQKRVLDARGLHIVTPEYNGSFPGVLKYFIDMLKFPESFDRKAVAFVGEANGTWGALRAVEQLQMIFGYRNAHIFPERVFIPTVNKALTPEGKFSDPALDQRIEKQVVGFAEFAGLICASCAGK